MDGRWSKEYEEQEELGVLYEDIDTEVDVKKKRLELIGPVVRMDQGRTVKKIIESEQQGSRRRGRSRFRCLEDVEKYPLEMKFKKWRRHAVEREEWASIIKETNALRGS